MFTPAVKAFTPEDIYIGSLEGYLEGLNAGVTSYVEHAHNNWDGAVVKPGYQAAVDSKTRVWWCYDIASRPDFPVEEQWGIISEIAAKISLAKATEAATERVCLGLSLDGLSGSSFGDAIQEIGVKAKQLGVQAFTMHHMGGPWPQGNSSAANMGKQGLPDAGIPIIFSHAPFLTDEDMSALREHDMFVSITPESECHFGHGQVTGKLISDHASLGFDTSWTFSGDMIGQARLWLQTVRNNSYTKTLVEKEKLPNMNPMTVEQAFLLATRQGARALKRDDIGVLQVGAKADLVVFYGDSPNMLGWSDPVAAVILHANPGDVQHVLVSGEFRKRDFELVVDVPGGWSGVRDRFVEAAQRIQVQVKTPPSLPGKLWGIGELGDVEISTTARIIDG
ncbi:hypothetical protein J7T55_012797 [Diaporthe amygdali]|uniref:uncharacterized protein n=1 Tax=Phomopsis amygdali TaxID=1214568 RepID=UPI0022FEB839|nr:uncharacterized protein J7T55_012797 [Diaporthe amygdali]KAJ0115517.1 hypothetical protein J7T55_012797 [Diaporthe amygdali]